MAGPPVGLRQSRQEDGLRPYLRPSVESFDVRQADHGSEERPYRILDRSPEAIIDTEQAVHRDISARRALEEALRARNAEIEEIVRAIPDAMVFADLDRRITRVNPAFTRLFGYMPEEVCGKRTRMLYADPADFEQQGRRRYNPRARATHEPYQVRYRRKDGTSFLSETVGTAVRDEHGEPVGLIAFVRNVTARSDAEEGMRRYQQRLKKSVSATSLHQERERRALADRLQERVGQTLAVCRMKAEEIAGRKPRTPGSVQAREISDLLREATRQIRGLTFELSPPILYQLGLAPAVAWLCERVGEENGMKVSFADGRLEMPLSDDVKATLFHAVRELLFNAAAHSGAREVRVRIERDSREIRVRVEDDGAGFDPAAAASGEGLGLFLTSERIEDLGGGLEIDAAPGRGARAALSLPLEAGA